MYSYKRVFKGKLQGCIFDWSGTLIDKYSIAPVRGIQETFKDYGIKVYGDEIRQSMGVSKKNHIRDVLRISHVKEQWKDKYGSSPTPDVLDDFYKQYEKKQVSVMGDYTEPVAFVIPQLKHLRSKRLKIGVTTGFNSNISNRILEDFNREFMLDSVVSSDDVLNGSRPSPSMLFKCMDQMGLNNVRTVLKCDDTVSGIEEGLNAGTWTVGVAGYSNYINVNSLEEIREISLDEFNEKTGKSYDILKRAGAHYVIRNFSELNKVISDINERLETGEKP